MDFDSLQADPTPQPTAAPQAQPSQSFDSMQDDSAAQPSGSFDDMQDDSQKYGTPDQQLGAGVEGLAQGIAGPLATLAETKLLGIKPEDIAGRQAANPWAHGIGESAGLVGGLMTGYGEAGLIAKVAEAIPGIASAGKVGSAIIKGAIENGVIQGGDELTNSMLGDSDPETPVASALTNMGYAGLIGGAFGGLGGAAAKSLSAIGDSKVGSKVGQVLEDFGNKMKFWKDNPSLVDSVGKELSDFHTSTSEAADDVYGPQGLKAQSIEKLVPQQMNDAISSQNEKIDAVLKAKLGEMVKDSDTYPARFTKTLQGLANDWSGVVNNPDVTPNQVFNATQSLKQSLQQYAKFDKQVNIISPERGWVDAAKSLQHDLMGRLEDTGVWGQAGELQKGVNGAFKEFLPAQKDFLSKFTEKVQGEPQVSPGKVNTYVNQLGKPTAEIKQGMLQNYVNAAEKYRDKISALHEGLGVESPIQPSSLNAVKGTYGVQTSGSKLADIFNKFVNSQTGAHTGEIVGGVEGAQRGYEKDGLYGGVSGGLKGALIGHFAPIVGRKLVGMSGPAMLKILGSGAAKGVLNTLDYAGDVTKGAQRINSGVSGLFKSGGKQVVTEMANEKNREKIKKYVSEGTRSQEIQKSIQDSQPTPSPTQSFAEGGEVQSLPEVAQPKHGALENQNSIATHYPNQNIMLEAAKGRVNGYLNSLKPQSYPSKLPFDKPMPNTDKERTYNKAIDIANDPLSVLNKIKDGTITPDHVNHLKNMYPEVYSHLSKKITQKIGESQLNPDKVGKPNYTTRQGMSLFLGAPMDSTFTPQNIMAAQAVFANQKSQPAPNTPVTKNKKNTSKIGEMSKQYETGDQARAARANA